MLVSTPFLLFLLDYWPLQRYELKPGQFGKAARLVVEKVPFMALAALSSGIKVTPGTAFAMDPTVQQNAVRACFGPAPSREAVREGFVKLRELIDKCPVEDCHTMA